MRKQNIRSLAVKAEQKCGSGKSDLKTSRQSGGAEAELQIFESSVKLDVRMQNLTSLTGPYRTGCHCQCWIITLLTVILMDNVKTICGWSAGALGNTCLNPFLGPSCSAMNSPSARRIGPLGSFVPAVFGRDVCLMCGSLLHVSWFDHAW